MKKHKKSKSVHETFQKGAEKSTAIMNEILGYLEEWVPKMRLEHWHISSNFNDQRSEEQPTGAACVAPLPAYETANAQWFLPVLGQMRPRDREETVVHELSHLVVAPMQQGGTPTKDIELVVTRLSRLLMAMKYGKAS